MSGRRFAGASILFALAALAAQADSADAGEIKALMTQAVRSVMEELGPKFERASGHRLAMTFGLSTTMAKRVQDGETADLLVSTRDAVDGLIAQSKVVPGSPATLARSAIGVAVRKGAPKPDISTIESFRRALLAARAISYTDPAGGGPSGVHIAKLLAQLRIADEMARKTVFPPIGGGLTARFLVSGEAELAFQQISELMSVEGVELVGPLPSDLQLVTAYVAAIPVAAREPDAAKAFMAFLRSEDASSAIAARGLEPGP